MDFQNLTLEVSYKVFGGKNEEGIRKTCQKIFSDWRSMIDNCGRVSVMFWTSDGSELLDYRGKLEDTFDWAKYLGVANPHGAATDLPVEKKSVHELPRLYSKDVPEFVTYGELKNVISLLKEEFSKTFGKELRVGTTFDPGPEFSKSTFKYERHTEICDGHVLGGKTFVCCYRDLDADDYSYAGFPEGIPQGTSFGRFLGRQSLHFCRDMGFDYIWLSNGFGFGMETWGACGAVFDGKSFDTSVAPEVLDKMLNFWKDFRTECPELPIETRGTNLSTGMDLSSDAVPLRAIYKEVPDLEVPPNSPWAALNSDFGLELAGWMSHIATLPEGKGYPFRFYIHDPWFLNSPWLDRYDRKPHDIYLPLSVNRLNDKGEVEVPYTLEFLTIDNSWGEMPRQVPDEVIPFIRYCRSTAPDAAGPFVWLYPFDEYHDMLCDEGGAEEIFFGDWYMRTAIASGLPINTVVSTENFLKNQDASKLGDCVIIAPTAVTKTAEVLQKLKVMLESGAQVLLYGPANQEELRNLLGLKKAEPVSGEMTMKSGYENIAGPSTCKHIPMLCGGEVSDVAAESDERKILASYVKDGESRVAAMKLSPAKWNGGGLVWVRGTNSFDMKENGNRPEFFGRSEYCYPEELMVKTLAEFGYFINILKHNPEQIGTMLTMRKHANAIHMAVHSPDITIDTELKLPYGAPVLSGYETVVKDGKAIYRFGKAENAEARVFVEQENGILSCKELWETMPGIKRRLRVSGLENATVHFFAEPGDEGKVLIQNTVEGPGGADAAPLLEPEISKCTTGNIYTLKNLTGFVTISWRK